MVTTARISGGRGDQSRDPATESDEVIPTDAEAIAELQRIIDSPDFDASARNREFLRFSVNEWIAGRADRIKAYAIAVEVFNRDDTFDPQTDPIVRIEASRLRRSLERYYMLGGASSPLRIDIPKGSYVPVFSRPNAPAVAKPDSPVADAVAHGPISADVRRPRARMAPTSRMTVRLALIGLALTSIALGGGQYLFGDRTATEFVDRLAMSPTGQEEAGSALARSRASILVLPYGTAGEEASETRFSRGLSEVVLLNLLRFDGIDVVDGQVAGAAVSDPLSAARELGADYVLRGTIMSGPQSIRISSQLSSVSTATVLWGNSIAVAISLDGLLSAIDSTAASVAAVIAQPYGVVYRDQLATAARQMPEAGGYLCQVIMYDYRAHLSAAGRALAEDCLAATVERDPDNAEAWAMFALVQLDKVRFAFRSADAAGDPMVGAVAAVEAAVDIHSDSALAQHALSEILFFSGDVEGAFAAAERAIDINPNNADFLAMYGMRLTMTGDVDRGAELMAAALALNPSPPGWYYFAPALRHLVNGDYDQALASAQRIAQPNLYLNNLLIGTLLGLLGRTDDAVAAFDDVERLNPGFFDCPRSVLEFYQLSAALQERVVDGLRLSGRVLPVVERAQDCPPGANAATVPPPMSRRPG